MVDGTAIGYSVYKEANREAEFNQLALAPMDLITSVNGVSIGEFGGALEAYRTLRGNSSATVWC